MGSYDVDFDNYEEKDGGYSGPEPRKGIYDGVLVSLKDHTSAGGNDGLEWQFDITEGEFAGWRGWVYSNMDSTMWRTQQIVKAIQGGSEEKTKIDTGKDGDAGTESKTVKKAKAVRLAIRTEKYDDGSGDPEVKARIRTILPMEDVGGSDGGKKKGKKKKKGDDPF